MLFIYYITNENQSLKENWSPNPIKPKTQSCSDIERREWQEKYARRANIGFHIENWAVAMWLWHFTQISFSIWKINFAICTNIFGNFENSVQYSSAAVWLWHVSSQGPSWPDTDKGGGMCLPSTYATTKIIHAFFSSKKISIYSTFFSRNVFPLPSCKSS